MKVSSAFISIPFASSPVQFLKHLFSQSPQARNWNKCTCVCTKVRSEAGITTSHISLSEVSLEFWISSKMAVRLAIGVRPGVFRLGLELKGHRQRWKSSILYIIKAVFAVVVRSYPLRAGTDHEFSRNFVGTDVSSASAEGFRENS